MAIIVFEPTDVGLAGNCQRALRYLFEGGCKHRNFDAGYRQVAVNLTNLSALKVDGATVPGL